ncbi:hypothetical protein SNEBB_003722 [Seison nebaliae]|nr:hypothetical protein SNEBB_003722 [Seison nebaliae]
MGTNRMDNDMSDVKPIQSQPDRLQSNDLRLLSTIEYLEVKQEVDKAEMIVNWEQANKYRIKKANGHTLLFAKERESGMCSRNCCKSKRSFTMDVMDDQGKAIFLVTRKFKCCASTICSNCCACNNNACTQEAKIVAADGTPYAFVRAGCSFVRPRYVVVDEEERDVLEVIGGMCEGNKCLLCRDYVLKIKSSVDGEQIGRIGKEWAGLGKEMFTKADNYNIHFPPDLDAKIKAGIIGTIFLLDFMYYEKKSD